MDQTNTSAGTAQQPAFEPVDSPIPTHYTQMHTAEGEAVTVRATREGQVVLHTKTDGAEHGLWLTSDEAVATGRELLKAAGAPDEAQQLREQRDDLLVLLKTVDAEGLIPDGFRLLRASVRALIARVEAA